jgi:colanic acid biosynthesis protein WcaH
MSAPVSNMWLSPDVFSLVLASTPLIAIDLVIQNSRGEILLGQRLNRPAQDAWFVPGGRVLKDETLDSAFHRLTQDELGFSLERSDAQLLGIYEHFYTDSVFGNAVNDPSTHYIVLAYKLRLDDLNPNLVWPQTQHGCVRWWNLDEACSSNQVHSYTKTYVQNILME